MMDDDHHLNYLLTAACIYGLYGSEFRKLGPSWMCVVYSGGHGIVKRHGSSGRVGNARMAGQLFFYLISCIVVFLFMC